jgi:hypothetical protein
VTYHGRTLGLHEDRACRDARAFFRDVRGAEAEAVRAQEIEALPTVEWKGHTLRTIRCTGTTGKGPHAMHVPERALWVLIDWRNYRCVYHA